MRTWSAGRGRERRPTERTRNSASGRLRPPAVRTGPSNERSVVSQGAIRMHRVAPAISCSEAAFERGQLRVGTHAAIRATGPRQTTAARQTHGPGVPTHRPATIAAAAGGSANRVHGARTDPRTDAEGNRLARPSLPRPPARPPRTRRHATISRSRAASRADWERPTPPPC